MTAGLRRVSVSVKFFSKLNYNSFGYFDPKNVILDNKNNYFSG